MSQFQKISGVSTLCQMVSGGCLSSHLCILRLFCDCTVMISSELSRHTSIVLLLMYKVKPHVSGNQVPAWQSQAYLDSIEPDPSRTSFHYREQHVYRNRDRQDKHWYNKQDGHDWIHDLPVWLYIIVRTHLFITVDPIIYILYVQ